MTLACMTALALSLQVSTPSPLPDLTWTDLDADGRVDLVVLDQGGGVRLLRNLGADGFVDETVRWGLAELPPVKRVLADDTDGDGSVDLVLAGPTGLRLLRQDGGVFVDATTVAGLGGLTGIASLTGVDTNDDGRSDLHVVAAGRHRVFASGPSGVFQELDLGLNTMSVAAFGSTVSVLRPGEDAQLLPDEEGTSERTPQAGNAGVDLGPHRGSLTTTTSAPGALDVTVSGPTVSGTTLGELPLWMSGRECVESLEDQAGGDCVQASSVPTLGMLYPISSELFVSAVNGRVGIGTTTPGYPLDVEGQLVSGVSNFAPGTDSAIGGGNDNRTDGEASVIAGGAGNWALGDYSVIGGGGGPSVGDRNFTQGNQSVIAGGRDNRISETGYATDPSADGATISGGFGNEIRATELVALFQLDSDYATIGGGLRNEIEAGPTSTIGGGDTNRIIADGSAAVLRHSTISGGEENLITAGGATIGGGRSNTVSGSRATVGGGWVNEASGAMATVAGGDQNAATGDRAMVPGGAFNRAEGDYSMAAGRSARALHDGSFVWADNDFSAFESTGGDQFLIRAKGGVGVGTNAPAAALDVRSDAGLSEAVRAWSSAANGIGVNAAGGTDGIGLLASGEAQAGFFIGEVQVIGGDDVSPAGGSFVQCGEVSGANVAIDDNEIMARNNGAVADLSLNIEGGNVEMIANGPGRVGIGTSSPSAKVDIFGESTADVFRVRVDGTTRLVLDGNGGLAVGANFTPSYDLEISSSAPNGGTAAKPGGGSWSSSSDRRLKKNIQDLEGALETLLALRGVTFEYRDPASINELEGTRTGFIAQEVEEVLPDWVSEKPDGMKMVTVRGFEALAVEALREVSSENEQLRAELQGTRLELAELRALVESLVASNSEDH